jgi:signal transduction histidine kinase
MPDLSTDSIREPLKVHHLSHDLRGPLSSILGFTELLLEGIEGPLNEIQTEDVGAIRQSAKGLLQLVNNMVDLSKLENGQLNLTFEPVHLAEVIDQILDSDLMTDATAQVELAVQVSASLPPLWGDPDRVVQMLFNLVRFACEQAAPGRVELGVEHDDRDAFIRIAAAGVATSEAELETVFDLAVDTDAAGRSKLGTGGLDLPLVRGLAQKHRGQVWAESQAEGGTIFCLKLPLSSTA